MFTDLVGYTALTQENESAALALLQKHAELLRPVFAKHGGHEVKMIGDSFLVEFSSALSASLCAIEVQRKLYERNVSNKSSKIELRIGIHVGDVVYRGADIFGDAVNIAARIEPLASPGSICISQQVYDQVWNKIDHPLTGLGKHELKNVQVPMEVYRIVLPWEKDATVGEGREALPSMDGVGELGTLKRVETDLPFVNREEELTLLKDIFAETVAGKGQVVLVVGEGGVGKTRLVRELGKTAIGQNAIFAVGSSYDEEGLIPYSPWIEAIRGIMDQASPEIVNKTLGPTLAVVSRLVPELAVTAKELGLRGWLSGPETGGLVSGTETDRVRLFQAVTDFLFHVSKQRPALLFLDDALWADPVSLQLLRYFCRRIRGHRLMVLVAYRDIELPEEHAISRLILDLNRERILRQVKLNRLTADHVAEIISNHLGGGPVAPEFAKLIHSRTGGNPFFVEEVLRSLSETRQVQGSERGWTLQEIEQVRIPSTVRALIKHRLSRLNNETLQILAAGSAVGMEFPYEVLRRLEDRKEEDLISLLEAAVAGSFLKEKRTGNDVSYVFADEQIREFLYDELSLIRKRKIHGRIAQVMEQLYQNKKDQRPEEFAYHYVRSGDLAKAAEFSLKAGDRAARLYAHAEAKAHYGNVLDLLEAEQNGERLDVLDKIGQVSYRLGEYQESVRYYRDAVSTAERLGQNRRVAQLCSKLGYAQWFLGDDKQAAFESYEKGLRALNEGQDPIEEATMYENMARILVLTGHAEGGLQLCEKALRIAKTANAHEALAHALQTYATALRPNSGNKADIFQYLEESLKISTDHHLEDTASRGLGWLGDAYALVKYDHVKAKETYLKGVEYCRKIGLSLREGWILTYLALRGYVPLGEWENALQAAGDSLRVFSEIGTAWGFPKSLVSLAVPNLLKGDIDKAEEHLTQAYPIAEKSQWSETIYDCCLASSKLYLEKNELGKAEQFLQRGLEAGHSWGLTSHAIEICFELVRLHCLRGELEKARGFYDRIKASSDELNENWAWAYERWAHGLLALKKEDWNGARDAFKKSSELWKELNYPYHYAQTLCELGKLLAQGKDGEEARKSLEEAKSVFVRLGASLDLKKLEMQSPTVLTTVKKT